MSLYHSTDCWLVSAILVSPYMPDGPEVVVSASTIAAGTAAFSSILLTQYFLNYYNRGSNYIIRCSI